MKVIVDTEVCATHGQCVFAAPTVFQLDARARLEYVAEPDEALRAAVEDAADSCPVQAITIVD